MPQNERETEWYPRDWPDREPEPAPAPTPPSPPKPTRRPRAQRPPKPSLPPADTVLSVDLDAVLWGALVVAAFGLRLARLDALPLTLDESSRAFAAFRLADGSVTDAWTGDLAAALTALLFAVFGESEWLARIVPALAGGSLVGAVWFLRPFAGRGAALAAALLIALSPIAVLAARSGLPFSLGALLSIVMVAALFTYLREPRTMPLAVFAGCAALAPSVDAIATGSLLAVAAFLLVEGGIRADPRLRRSYEAFRANPSHQAIAALIAVWGLALGLTHFGTTTEKLGLAGLTQWGDMFGDSDGRFWAYAKLLAAYDWPLAIGGAAAFVAIAYRLIVRREETSLFQRLLLVWAAVSLVTLLLTTRRESGQLLLLLIPFALLAGTWLEELAASFDWSAVRRWALPLAGAAVLVPYALVVLTRWAEATVSGQDKAYMMLALLGAAVLIGGAFPALGRDASAVALTAAGVVAAAFLVHTSLSVVANDGSEFAAGARAGPHLAPLANRVAAIADARDGPIVVDPVLREPLEWYLRDHALSFGDPGPDVAAYIGTTGPAGFLPDSGPRLTAESWYPVRRDLLDWWSWLLYRRPFGNLSTTDAQIYLPEP